MARKSTCRSPPRDRFDSRRNRTQPKSVPLTSAAQQPPLVMVLHGIVVQMTDQDRWEVLGRVAESQGGYVTTAQAEEAGFHRNALRHHAREGGRLEHAG